MKVILILRYSTKYYSNFNNTFVFMAFCGFSETVK
nr:MAG TPA: hypothetical protein [Caudoviricetes sp.]